MNIQAKPNIGGAQRLLPFERIALVLQGGGAHLINANQGE